MPLKLAANAIMQSPTTQYGARFKVHPVRDQGNTHLIRVMKMTIDIYPKH